MIQVSAMPNISYTERIASQYNANSGATVADRIKRAESVTISDAGRAINEIIEQVVTRGEMPKPLHPGDLPAIPVWMGSYEETRQRAEDGLKVAMQQLGIPLNTRVSIKTNTDGTISVESNSDKNAELEAIVNNNLALSNVIKASEGNAYLIRIGDAYSQAQSAMNANPGKADYYNNWLIGAVQRIMGMGFEFNFTDGKLSGSFLSNGQQIGLMGHMERLVV